MITLSKDVHEWTFCNACGSITDVEFMVIKNQNTLSFEKYKALIEAGCPRELARSVLPVGTYSHMFATANLHNWFRFIAERLHHHAQYEIRVYAQAILEYLEEIAPVATQAFKDFQLNAA